MAKIVYFLLVVLLIASVVLAEKKTCSPWLEHCQVYEDCCRHLVCITYTGQCVPKGGLVVPGQDTRPLGPGPYPPNQPDVE